jgi:cytidyltransferase-like protein
MKKTVITYGTFDIFHIGHLKLLQRLKGLGDELIVAVSTDEFNLQKGKKTLIPFEHRKEIVENFVNLDNIENSVSIIRMSDLIITDYSSLFLDALYCDKKLYSFSYDFQDYLAKEHGFFYNFEEVFPGNIIYTVDELIECIRTLEDSITEDELLKRKRIKKIFFKYIDTNNSQRVVDKVKEIAFE